MRLAAALLCTLCLRAQTYDTVIANGRLIDPASSTDAIRHIGIRAGKVAAISATPLTGKSTIDATNLIVAPGFIDLHWHGRETASGAYQVMDGVTTALELEVGTATLDSWYAARAGHSYVNFGAAIGHPPIRMAIMKDPGSFLPSGPAAHRKATDAEINEMRRLLEEGLRQGAPAVGFGIAYTEAASYWEILEMFRIAARYQASCHVHIRGASSAGSSDREQGLSEVIAAAAITGAPLHVVHINSSSQEATTRMLQVIHEARTRGLDITTEAYPYTAGATAIESAVFDSWMDRAPADYQRLQWIATGERLTRDTFLKYRKQGGTVIIHANTEEKVREAILSPLTMIASDGFDVKPGQGHPRSAGTYSRILGHYVRDTAGLSWIDAIRKMSLMPAQRLERRVPAMRNKGRIQQGADADITIFDPQSVHDRATYTQPATYSEGIRHVLINGQPVVANGRLLNVRPGLPVRAPAAAR